MGDDRILQVSAGTSVYDGIQLRVDFIVGKLHGPADLFPEPVTRRH